MNENSPDETDAASLFKKFMESAMKQDQQQNKKQTEMLSINLADIQPQNPADIVVYMQSITEDLMIAAGRIKVLSEFLARMMPAGIKPTVNPKKNGVISHISKMPPEMQTVAKELLAAQKLHKKLSKKLKKYKKK